MNIVHLEQGSQEWLDWRKTKRMASEAAAAMGKSDYTTPKKLAMQKRGLEKVFVNSAMSRGTKYEPAARAWFEAETGTIGQPVVMESGEYGASLDFLSSEGIAEFKVPSSETAPLWVQAKNGEIPLMYQIQMTQQMAVAGWDHCHFCVYLPEAGHGHIQRFGFSEHLWNSIQDGWDRFWQEFMVGDIQDDERDDDLWIKTVGRYLAAKTVADEASDRLAAIKKELIGLAPQGAKGGGLQLIHSTREGAISWSKAIKKLNLDMALFEPFRGESSEVYTVKEQ